VQVSNIVDELVALVDKRCEELDASDRADFLAMLCEDVAERADAAYDDLPSDQDEGDGDGMPRNLYRDMVRLVWAHNRDGLGSN